MFSAGELCGHGTPAQPLRRLRGLPLQTHLESSRVSTRTRSGYRFIGTSSPTPRTAQRWRHGPCRPSPTPGTATRRHTSRPAPDAAPRPPPSDRWQPRSPARHIPAYCAHLGDRLRVLSDPLRHLTVALRSDVLQPLLQPCRIREPLPPHVLSIGAVHRPCRQVASSATSSWVFELERCIAEARPAGSCVRPQADTGSIVARPWPSAPSAAAHTRLPRRCRMPRRRAPDAGHSVVLPPRLGRSAVHRSHTSRHRHQPFTGPSGLALSTAVPKFSMFTPAWKHRPQSHDQALSTRALGGRLCNHGDPAQDAHGDGDHDCVAHPVGYFLAP